MIEEHALKDFKMNAISCLEQAERDCSSYRLLDSPGDIIQCPPSAVKDGRFYVMGFNPHGSGGTSLRHTTMDLSNAPIRDHPLDQASGSYWKNLCNLAEGLSFPADWKEDLFITNLFPDCSEDVPAWKERCDRPISKYVAAIWPLHELMLSIVRPRFVIASGIKPDEDSAFHLLWGKLKPDIKWDDTMSYLTKERDRQVKSFSVNNLPVRGGDLLARVTFIGVKHFSRGGPSDSTVIKALIDSELRWHG